MKVLSVSRIWWARHCLVVGLAVALVALALASRAEWSSMHRWNRALGDASLVMVASAMAIGPLGRLWRPFVIVVPFRRELGIYSIVLALAHTLVVILGWVELDLLRLIGLEFHRGLQQYVMVQHGFALANVVGALALVYGFVLATTSNDVSIRSLGPTVWKFVQRGTYVFWWLVVMHTGYFLFIHFLSFHREVPELNWAQWPFVVVVLAVVLLQLAASALTWRNSRRTGPMPIH